MVNRDCIVIFATSISPHEESLFAGHLEWVSCVRLLPDEIIDRKNRHLAVVVRCEVARDGVIGCFAAGGSDAVLRCVRDAILGMRDGGLDQPWKVGTLASFCDGGSSKASHGAYFTISSEAPLNEPEAAAVEERP